MREIQEIKDMMLLVQEQGQGKSGIISTQLDERFLALAWVLDYPEVPTLILSDNEIVLLECF